MPEIIPGSKAGFSSPKPLAGSTRGQAAPQPLPAPAGVENRPMEENSRDVAALPSRSDGSLRADSGWKGFVNDFLDGLSG